MRMEKNNMSDILDIKLQNSPFVYRDILTVPRNVNFGLELELDKIDPNRVYKLIRRSFGSDWQIKTDASLTEGENAEIVSPVLQNNKQTWILLKKMGELLEKLSPDYDSCSLQVNFDGKLLPTAEDKVRFLKLYAMYEDIIYHFSKGEDSEYRSSLEVYASPIILTLKGVLPLGNRATIEMFSNNKRYGIVFKENKDLIEFRTPNMTNNTVLWQNYFTFFYYFLAFSIRNRYSKEEVDQYIQSFSKTYILENYELEKRQKAYQLCKTIFPHSIDQIHFMHQYIGNGSKKSNLN